MIPTQSQKNILKVAVIGSGPAGFYACEALLKQEAQPVEVHLYDKLPTPYGLVRGGVAPDHQHIKVVTRLFNRTAARSGFQFFGNVTFGRDFSLDDALKHYHQVLICCGAEGDRSLGIEGESLAGSHAATAFVGWYNGHPDYTDFPFDSTVEEVVVIGNGNVAIDVTRILAKSRDELGQTDIAEPALEALKKSNIRHIHVLGRRGPAQAAFTNPELRELTQLAGVDLCLREADLQLDQHSAQHLQEKRNVIAERNLDLLRTHFNKPKTANANPKCSIHLNFLSAPYAILGTTRVEAVQVERTHIALEDVQLRAVGSGTYYTLPAQMVLRSVGYKSFAVSGVPFDEKRALIPNILGRVQQNAEKGAIFPRVYAAGWIKRGPTGVVGTNKADAQETVRAMLEDASTLLQDNLELLPTTALENQFASQKNIQVVSFNDWCQIDDAEKLAGEPFGQPRKKMLQVSDMLAAITAK